MSSLAMRDGAQIPRRKVSSPTAKKTAPVATKKWSSTQIGLLAAAGAFVVSTGLFSIIFAVFIMNKGETSNVPKSTNSASVVAAIEKPAGAAVAVPNPPVQPPDPSATTSTGSIGSSDSDKEEKKPEVIKEVIVVEKGNPQLEVEKFKAEQKAKEREEERLAAEKELLAVQKEKERKAELKEEQRLASLKAGYEKKYKEASNAKAVLPHQIKRAEEDIEVLEKKIKRAEASRGSLRIRNDMKMALRKMEDNLVSMRSQLITAEETCETMKKNLASLDKPVETKTLQTQNP